MTSHSEDQTQRIAAALASHVGLGDVIALEGPLGSGKTCFVRGLAEGLGINPRSVSSPTFIICQEYGTSRSTTALAPMPLVHIDAYRLHSADELDTIGWNEMIDSADAVIAIEWPSRINQALPAGRIQVDFQHEGSNDRVLRITVPEHRTELIEHLLSLAATLAAPEASCRTCGKSVERNAASFPFCSQRCRLADLGKWFNEGYRVSRPVQEDEELDD